MKFGYFRRNFGQGMAAGLRWAGSSLLASSNNEAQVDDIEPRWQLLWNLVGALWVCSLVAAAVQVAILGCLACGIRGHPEHIAAADPLSERLNVQNDAGSSGIAKRSPAQVALWAVAVLYLAVLAVVSLGFFAHQLWPAGEVFTSSAVTPPCAGSFCSPRFGSKEIKIQSNVIYGSAMGRMADNLEYGMQKLPMDVYTPTGAGTARPAVIYVHGGGFIGGSRTSVLAVEEANFWASLGFVAFSIGYRNDGVAFLSEVGSVTDAVHDAKAAVRYVKTHSASLGVDPNRIAVQGASAGAIIAASLSYVDEGDSGNPGPSSNVSAAIGLSGTIWPFLLKKEDSSMPPDAIAPYFDVHGSADDRVYPFLARMTYNYLKSIGVAPSRNRLAIVEGGGHVCWGDEPALNAQARRTLRPHLTAWLVDALGLSEL